MPTLSDYSVKFGRDPVMGLEGVNAHPYFYGLINQNDTDWTPGQTPPDLSTFTVRCRNAAVTSHYVRIEPDYNYKLIAIKYCAYYKKTIPGDPDTYQYEWYENVNAAAMYHDNIIPGTPYTGNIFVSLAAQGSGSTVLFGGQNINPLSNGVSRIPLAVSCMQGYESGYQALRCEYLLPLQGILSFEFTNSHPTKELLVAAMLYGMKIRL